MMILPQTSPADVGFYAPTKVHAITLALTQAEWDSMTPTRNGSGVGGPMGGMEYPEIKTTVTIDGKEYVVGLRFKGNSSYMSSARGYKRPFKIDLNQFVKGQNIGGLTKLNLNNNFSDRTNVRETLAYEAFRRMGIPAPKTTLANVILKLGDQKGSLGLYTLAEQLDTNFLKERFGTGEGLLLKPEGVRGGVTFLGSDWTRYERPYDPKGKSTTAEKARFIAFAKLVHQADDATFAREIGGYLDVPAFAKFLAATVVTSNGDSLLAMGHNFYIWHNPKTDKFVFLPWDLNMAFGGFPIGDAVKLSVKKPYSGELKLLDRFLALPEGRSAYEKACRDGAKVLTELNALHDAASAAGKPIAALYTEGAMGFGPPGMGGSNDLKTFFAQRSASVLAQLDGKEEGVVPQGGPFGGRPGGFNIGAMLGNSFLALTGAGEAPRVSAVGAAWRTGARAWDKSRDGKLSRAEVIQGVAAFFDGEFGPGQFLGPQLWAALKAEEPIANEAFATQLEKWAGEWDADKDGTLTAAEAGAGMQKILPPPDFGGG